VAKGDRNGLYFLNWLFFMIFPDFSLIFHIQKHFPCQDNFYKSAGFTYICIVTVMKINLWRRVWGSRYKLYPLYCYKHVCSFIKSLVWILIRMWQLSCPYIMRCCNIHFSITWWNKILKNPENYNYFGVLLCFYVIL
jgi:hypothetical protein